MNSSLFSPGSAGGISLPLGRSTLLLVAPHAAAPLMLELAARLSTTGAVRVLDGGNRFNVYPVSQGIRRLTGNIYPCLEQISLARAFTCYQMLALLEETPAIDAPTLLLDFLATFNDESVPLPESLRLLEVCLPHFHRLSAQAPLVISAKPVPAVTLERGALLERLQEIADQQWVLEPARTVRMQPTLWEGY
jgi:hypothetical protein